MHIQQHQEVLEWLEQGGSVLEGHCLIEASMYILMACRDDPSVLEQVS